MGHPDLAPTPEDMPQRDRSRDHQYTQAENAHADLAFDALMHSQRPER